MDAASSSPPAVEPSIALEWSRSAGGESCLGREELTSRVEATIGRRFGAPSGGADVQVHGEIGPSYTTRGWIAVVELRHVGKAPLRRELTLQADDCRRFDEALVLVVALMVDTASPGPATLSVATPHRGASISIGPSVALASGMLPGVTVGAGLASEAAFPPVWPISLHAHAWPGAEALAGPTTTGGRIGAWTIGAAVCPRFYERPSWELFACGGISGGAVYASGVGLDVSRSSTRPYFQAEALAGVRARVAGPVLFRLEVGGALPLTRDSYAFTGADGTTTSVFETAALVPLAMAGLEVRQP